MDGRWRLYGDAVTVGRWWVFFIRYIGRRENTEEGGGAVPGKKMGEKGKKVT
jgi:hypothetical protein